MDGHGRVPVRLTAIVKFVTFLLLFRNRSEKSNKPNLIVGMIDTFSSIPKSPIGAGVSSSLLAYRPVPMSPMGSPIVTSPPTLVSFWPPKCCPEGFRHYVIPYIGQRVEIVNPLKQDFCSFRLWTGHDCHQATSAHWKLGY